MSNVEEWAKRKGARYATGGLYDERGPAYADGLRDMAALLLSDDVRAAAKAAGFRALDGAEQVEDTSGNLWDIGDAIDAALQAALDKITEDKE